MTTEETIDVALCRSALWEALAVGFRPPTERTLVRLGTEGGAVGLWTAAEFLDESLGAAVRDLATSAPGLDELRLAHGRLFGHTVRGPVPAYEAEYGQDDTVRQPHELADLGGFYRAFGLQLAPGGGERPDHVSCECEFLLFLARREAAALEAGDADAACVVREATRAFLRDHAGRFLPAFAARVERADPHGFYGALARLAAAVVAAECERAGVAPGAAGLTLRTIADDGAPMACGSCPQAAPDVEGDADAG